MLTEAELERKCLKHAKANGAYLPKWVSPGHAGVPDRILIIGNAVTFIEFKRPGGKLTPLQRMWQQRLGENHHVIDNFDDFITLFETLSEGGG